MSLHANGKKTEARDKDILDANTKIDGTNTQFVEFKDVVTDKFGTQGEKLEGIVADYKPQYADKNHFADSSRSVQWTYWKTVARDNYATNERVTKLQSDVKDSNATITQSILTLVTKEEAISQTIDNLSVKTNNNTASITDIRETVTNGLSSQAERIETMEVDYKPQYANKNQYASATRSVQWTYWKTVAKDNYAANERITQLKSEVGENNSSVTQSINTLVTKDESIAKSVDNLRATTNDNISAIKTELSSTTSKTNATASSVSTLQTTVRGNTASIQVAQSSIDGVKLQYTVKLDSGGKISGFGMMNDGATSAFDVRADRFSISPPVGKPNDVSGSSPFMVITTPTTINGIFVDSGVYMRKAYIARASIDRAHIKDLAVDTLQINGNAITVPLATYTADENFVSASGANETPVQSIVVPNIDGNKAITISFSHTVRGTQASASTMSVSIYLNNPLIEGDKNLLRQTMVSRADNYTGGSFSTSLLLGRLEHGTLVVTAQCSGNPNGGTVSSRFISVIITKR